MKALKYSFIIISAFVLFSCEKENEGVSWITYYPILNGEPVLTVPVNGNYTEQGSHVIDKGEDRTSQIAIESDVNISEIGVYHVLYTYTNTDNIKQTITRTVYVYDPSAPEVESGTYVVQASSNRNGTTLYGKNFNITIEQLCPGFIQISDLFGGYYALRAGYGAAYACWGILAYNGTGFSLIDFRMDPWGYGFSSADGAYDVETGAWTFVVGWSSYTFNLFIIKKEE